MKSLVEYIFEKESSFTLTKTYVDGHEVSVVDVINYNNSNNDARCMSDETGDYSIIYKDKTLHVQPAYSEMQERVQKDLTNKEFNNVLILGGAGCSIPRFFLLEYPGVNVTTIEYSPEIINIANKYFLNDLSDTELSKHHLINGDAFKFVKDAADNTYDYVFVDLFNSCNICEEVYSKEFLDNLNRITTANAIISINISINNDLPQIFKDTYKDVHLYKTENYNYIYIIKNGEC